MEKKKFSMGSLCASANELEEAVKQERLKWKKFRIQQVREQARQEARRIREAVHKKESQIVHDIKQELHDQWQAEKENQVQRLQHEYKESLETLGEAHALARLQPDANEILSERAYCNQQKAEKRGLEARKTHRERQLQQKQEKNKLLKQRQDALNWEKLRANRVANLPTPDAYKKKLCVVEKKVPTVQFHEAGTFTTSTYVPKNVVIEKEVKCTKPSAKQAAVAEEMAQAALAEAKLKAAEEEDRKREKRGNEALARERLCRMYQQLMSKLDQAQHDHQLSAYLKGTDDHSVYETEESRWKRRSKLQRQMEKAVEEVLQKDDALQTEDVSCDYTQPSVDSSGLLEATDASRILSDQQTSCKRIRDMKSLLEEIKKRRHEILHNVYGSLPEEEGISEEEVTDIAKDEQGSRHTRQNEKELDASHSQTQVISQGEEGGEETTVTDIDQQQDSQCKRSVCHGEKDEDIHMAETIPVHFLPGYHDGRSIITSQRNVSESPFTQIFYEKSGSEDVERQVDTDGSIVETQTSDEYISHPSPVSKLPEDRYFMKDVSSETSRTDYRGPLFSLPSRKSKDSLRETQPQSQYRSSKPINIDDIHLADTVPVHLLDQRISKKDRSSERKASEFSATKSSFQESSSDDIEIKIKIRGDESTLGTVTPSEEEIPGPVSSIADCKHPAEDTYSGTSSTDYISPPSSLPASKFLPSQLGENLRKLQQQRHSIQHLLDSVSSRTTQQSSHQKTTPSVYYEELKGEGNGKRPLKKKSKFEMQKKEILQFYMKKLLQMKGDELVNMSASTVEGSGITVSSLSSFLEFLQRQKGDSVLTISSSESRSPSSSVRESNAESTSTSNYPDIDEVPVRLSSYSSSDSKYSYGEKTKDTRISDLSAGYRSDEDQSREGHEPPIYSHSRASLNSSIAKPTPHASQSLSSQSNESKSLLSSGDPTDIKIELQGLDNIKKLQQLRQELMNLQQKIFQEDSGTAVPKTESSSPSFRSEAVAAHPSTSSDSRQPRKVTFGSTHQRAGLSTIYEASSDLSESHLNISGSTSYQTPSREYESSLDDAGNQVSLLQRQDSETFHMPQGTRHQNEVALAQEATSDEQTADGNRMKFMRWRTHMTFQSRFRHCEYATLEGMPTSSTGDRSLEHSTPHHSNMTDDQDNMPHKVSSESTDNQPGNGSSNESVASMPDMAEILQRFGLDWAQSMIRKMDKTEQRSSSDSSASQGS